MFLGATPSADGTRFALFSSVAERVELCFFDAEGRQTLSRFLFHGDDDVWFDHVTECNVGQRYGYRVHGPWAPDEGLLCNPAKLLIDPYARRLDGTFKWHDSLLELPENRRNKTDSSPYVPKSVVTSRDAPPTHIRPAVPWNEAIFYECNLRGYTMRHPAVGDDERGRFKGMRNADVLTYIKALGVTSIELMPVHAFVDEHHLHRKGLRNYWGYNSINFFAPMERYGSADPVVEMREMVRAIHDAGLEVILDVVYNHTGEGDRNGPTLSFRGIDNLAYYRVDGEDPSQYINDTGCGNTINADHARVRQIVVESLAYYHDEIGFDGFRFDLAPVLGRHANGFAGEHPLLAEIAVHPALKDAKLTAEPWDPGPGGYQLGQFPAPWAEWNDKFRDTARRFWRGDDGTSGSMARRLHGSADLFEPNGRGPSASVNFISSHDGFTLMDIASYETRHNEANGEENRDGHAHNYSLNHGHEGETSDAAIAARRRQHRLNLMATLLFSQGTPLLLAGDEFGNSQGGNNNAYAQDNDTGWLDWSGLDKDPEFVDAVKTLLQLRRELHLLRLPVFIHDLERVGDGSVQLDWTHASGDPMSESDWPHSHAFSMILEETGPDRSVSGVIIALNGYDAEKVMKLPVSNGGWEVRFRTDNSQSGGERVASINLGARSLALLSR